MPRLQAGNPAFGAIVWNNEKENSHSTVVLLRLPLVCVQLEKSGLLVAEQHFDKARIILVTHSQLLSIFHFLRFAYPLSIFINTGKDNEYENYVNICKLLCNIS